MNPSLWNSFEDPAPVDEIYENTSAWSSYESLYLDLEKGHRDSTDGNDHQDDIPYSLSPTVTAQYSIRACIIVTRKPRLR